MLKLPRPYLRWTWKRKQGRGVRPESYRRRLLFGVTEAGHGTCGPNPCAWQTRGDLLGRRRPLSQAPWSVQIRKLEFCSGARCPSEKAVGLCLRRPRRLPSVRFLRDPGISSREGQRRAGLLCCPKEQLSFVLLYKKK